MAARKGALLFKNCNTYKVSFSTLSCVNNKWRIQQGLEPNPRQFSPLNTLPDYSFVDGRLCELSKTKMMKVKYQMGLCKRIYELTNEIDVGLENYYKKVEQQKQEREEILNRRLKPKGAALSQKFKQ